MAIAANGTAQAGSGSLGAAVNLSLTSFSTGALMIWAATMDGSTAPGLPAGWTNIANATIGTHIHRVAYRVKQGGDTAVITTGMSGLTNTSAAVEAVTGATYGEVSTLVSGTGGATSIDPAAVTIDATSSWSLLAVFAGTGSLTLTYPAGWTQVAGNSSNQTVTLANNTSPAAGSLDPAAVTFASATDRGIYHIELVAVALALVPDPTAAVGGATGLASAATFIAPSAAGAATASGTLSTSMAIAPSAAAAATATGAAEYGAIPAWKGALRKFKAGTGKATVVAIGDSLTEGFNAGANARTDDMWVTAAGLILARMGGKVNASRYMPTATIDAAIANAWGPWPEGADPWTRSGSLAGSPNNRGLGLRAVILYASSSYVEIAAPTWATHAVVQLAALSAGVPIEIRSNGVLVHSETLTNTLEHSIVIPLQGSGNLLRTTVIDATPGFLTVSGYVWQKDAHPAGQILVGSAAAANANLGGTASASLTSMVTGDLMVAVIAQNNGAVGPVTTPSGWTSRGTRSGASTHYRVCTRVKQSGDTALAVTGGGVLNTDIAVASYNGATWGSISSAVFNNAAGSTIDPPALDVTLGDASLVIVGEGNGTAGAPFTFPAGWNQNVKSSGNASIGIAARTSGLHDELIDPSIVTYSDTSAPDRVVWQGDLIRSNNDRSTLVFTEVLDAGHGGFQAHHLANPVGSPPPTGTYSGDLTYVQFDDIAALFPDLIVLFFGFNDISNGRTAADFQTSLETIITNLDLHMSAPDVMLITYPYLDPTLSGITPTWLPSDWALFEAAAAAVAANHPVRVKYVRLSDYLGPFDGVTGTWTSADHVHPTAYGQRTMGSVIAGALADSFVTLAPSTSGSAAATGTVAYPRAIAPSAAATGTASAVATLAVPIAPAAAGTGSASATVTASALLAPSASGTAGASATAVAIANVSGTATGAAAASLNVTASAVLTTTATAVAAATALVHAPQSIAFSTAAVASTSALVTATMALSPAPAAGAGSASAIVLATVVLSGSTAGAASASLAITAASRLTPATITALGSATGAAFAIANVTATSSAIGHITCGLQTIGVVNIEPGFDAASDVTATVTATLDLSPSVTTSATASLVVSAPLPIAPSASPSAMVSTDLTAPSLITPSLVNLTGAVSAFTTASIRATPTASSGSTVSLAMETRPNLMATVSSTGAIRLRLSTTLAGRSLLMGVGR